MVASLTTPFRRASRRALPHPVCTRRRARLVEISRSMPAEPISRRADRQGSHHSLNRELPPADAPDGMFATATKSLEGSRAGACALTLTSEPAHHRPRAALGRRRGCATLTSNSLLVLYTPRQDRALGSVMRQSSPRRWDWRHRAQHSDRRARRQLQHRLVIRSATDDAADRGWCRSHAKWHRR